MRNKLFQEMLDNTPLDTRFKVVNEMAFIDLISKLDELKEFQTNKIEEIKKQVEDLSVRYYTTEINMTPELMKEKVLEILNKQYE